MRRLRRGKSLARGSKPGGCSVKRAALGDCALERGVLGRIDVIDAAGEHCDRPGFEARLVGCGVDAARKAGHDGIARARDLGRKETRELGAGRGGLTGADNRDRGAREERA